MDSRGARPLGRHGTRRVAQKVHAGLRGRGRRRGLRGRSRCAPVRQRATVQRGDDRGRGRQRGRLRSLQLLRDQDLRGTGFQP